MTTPDSPDHHGSHRDLLWTPVSSPSWEACGKVDAIIVPTVRPAAYLANAVMLAGALDCTLVTLHSGRWTSCREVAAAVPPEVSLIAIDVPDAAGLRLLDFETTRMLADTPFARRADQSLKRNLGLLLGHRIGWQRIVFLDDDIQVPDARDLSRAAGLLSTFNAVGLSNEGFPDNSVVCHAYRAVGGKQDSFIGGGALAVEIVRNRSFFPDIYNEDWFYLLDPVRGLQSLAVTGHAIQGKFDPFRNEDRARREEFGDVLAEGIFWVLDQGGTLSDADIGHWAEFIARRRRFVRHVLDLVNTKPLEPAEQARMAAALRASLGRLELIEPDKCEKYLAAWAADRQGWEQLLQSVRSGVTPEEAVRLLSRKGTRPVTCVVRRGLGSPAWSVPTGLALTE